jgi:alkanesulfonate monooxygenase SsuD/methylene tetrahydromethanopterin reductase-like flavin-dependent oxidoreductase (luciferase family)
MIGEFTQLASANGKPMDGFDWCAQRRVSIGRTIPEAESHIEWMVREQADMWKYVGHLYDQRQGGTALSHTMATVGTAADIVENLRSYVEAGVTYFAMAFTYPKFDVLLEQMDLFAREVIPQVRDLRPAPVH